MIPERYMATGKRIDNATMVTGFIFEKQNGRTFIVEADKLTPIWHIDADDFVEVYCLSVEPVAVKVSVTDCRCPNCNNPLLNVRMTLDDRWRRTPPYCYHCGQRLEWVD
jgi:hypothetical protein